MRKWMPVAAIGAGLVLIASAGLMRWVVAPKLAVLPGDTDTTRTYTGSAATLFNAQALTSGGPVLLHHVPVTMTHRTRVLDTNGNNALIADSGTVMANGSPVGGFHYRYAVDRTDMGPGTGFSGVVKQSGITFNFPIHTARHDYPGWVSDTGSTVPLTYQGTATHGGLATYVFRTVSKPTLITDPETLQSLPPALPKATITQLAGSLGLPGATLSALSQLLPTLPDPVPFSYTFQTTATYWVEPTTGEIVDLRERDVRTLALKAGNQLIPMTPIFDVTYTSSATELASAVKQARHDATAVNLVYRTLPLTGLVAGLVLFIGGAIGTVLTRRRRPSAPTATGSPTVEQPEPQVAISSS